MKLKNPKITMLINSNSTEISIYDSDSGTCFVQVTLSATQLSQMLSRLSNTECECSVYGLDKLGKKMENKSFEFPIGQEIIKKEQLLNKECLIHLKDKGMADWKPDAYYGSQNSFFTKDGQGYARVTIRRWVDIKD